MKKYKLTEEEIKDLISRSYIDGASDGWAKDTRIPSEYAAEAFSRLLARRK